ncbi:MAG: hypothetical protein JXB19_08830 [Bacteroidales bacterium]|nr:hypothetical protein [Bacteroidales bacterium]
MKKTSVLVMLFSIITLSLTQYCRSDRNTDGSGQSIEPEKTVYKPPEKIYEHKETVRIYLTSVKQAGENGDTAYHLAMFDANGDYAIDSLTTVFVISKERKSGHIKWKLVQHSGIQEIIEFKPEDGVPHIIFQEAVIQENEDEWNLDLTEDMLKKVNAEGVTEKYIIKYIPEHYNDTVTIDPYIKIPPPQE